MSLSRSNLKQAMLALLDAAAEVHPCGHQNVKAARYVIRAADGGPIEVMFEKNRTTGANIWMTTEAGGPLVQSAGSSGRISQVTSLASELFSTLGKDGRPEYGRHSGLKLMPQLFKADLVCLTPRNLEEFGRIVDQAFSASVSSK